MCAAKQCYEFCTFMPYVKHLSQGEFADSRLSMLDVSPEAEQDRRVMAPHHIVAIGTRVSDVQRHARTAHTPATRLSAHR